MNTSDPDELLRRALGPEPAPRPIADDVMRGRRALARRRVVRGAALAVAGAAAAATAVVVPTLGLGATGEAGPSRHAVAPPTATEATASPTAGPATAAYIPEELTEDEVIERCADQILALTPDADVSTYTIDLGGTVLPVHVSDQVALVSPEITDGSTSCQVPGTWAPDPPVDLQDEPPSATDSAQILTECGAVIGVDLGDWTVASVMRNEVDSSLTAMLLSPDTRAYGTCELELGSDPFSSIPRAAALWPLDPAGLHDMKIEERHEVTLEQFFYVQANAELAEYACGAKPGPGVPCETFSTNVNGILPAGIEALTIVLGDGTRVPVQVGPHGTYAWDLAWDHDVPPPVIDAYDGAGGLVGTYALYPDIAPRGEG